jgi:hypothetical protein
MAGGVLSPDCFFDLPELHETKIKTEAIKTINFFIDIDFCHKDTKAQSFTKLFLVTFRVYAPWWHFITFLQY